MSVQKNSTATPATKPTLPTITFADYEMIADCLKRIHSICTVTGKEEVLSLDPAITTVQLEMGADLTQQVSRFLRNKFEPA